MKNYDYDYDYDCDYDYGHSYNIGCIIPVISCLRNANNDPGAFANLFKFQ